MTLTGEGQFNLNSLNEIEITEAFTSLDDETKGCRISEESHDDCTTREGFKNLQ